MVTLAPEPDFQQALAHARLEALTILRRAMTDEEHPPSKEAIRAAITILRLPKHLTTTPCHAGDEPPPSSSSISSSMANPRVSPAPHTSPSPHPTPPHTPLLNHTPTPTTPSSTAHRPFPIPSRSSSPIAHLLSRAGQAPTTTRASPLAQAS